MGTKMNNYEKTKENIRPRFLEYDQEEMIEKFHLDHNEKDLFVDFTGNRYKICRKTGKIEKEIMKPEGMAFCGVSYEEALSIYDMLCYSTKNVEQKGGWCLVNSLPGTGQNSGVGDNARTKENKLIDEHPREFEEVCKELGGEKICWGDIGYEIPVFPFFSVRIRFYHSDEEFASSFSLYFRENTLEFIHYETTYYIADCLLGEIKKRMEVRLEKEMEN